MDELHTKPRDHYVGLKYLASRWDCHRDTVRGIVYGDPVFRDAVVKIAGRIKVPAWAVHHYESRRSGVEPEPPPGDPLVDRRSPYNMDPSILTRPFR